MWRTIFPGEIKDNHGELSVPGPGNVHLWQATHTHPETVATRDRGANKKAEDSCFFSTHTLGDKDEKDRYRHRGEMAHTSTGALKKSHHLSCVSVLHSCPSVGRFTSSWADSEIESLCLEVWHILSSGPGATSVAEIH